VQKISDGASVRGYRTGKKNFGLGGWEDLRKDAARFFSNRVLKTRRGKKSRLGDLRKDPSLQKKYKNTKGGDQRGGEGRQTISLRRKVLKGGDR